MEEMENEAIKKTIDETLITDRQFTFYYVVVKNVA